MESALNSHGNYIVDHGKSWKNHGIVFLNFCGNPARYLKYQNLMYWLIFSMFSDKEIIRILCIYLAYLRDHVNESAYK